MTKENRMQLVDDDDGNVGFALPKATLMTMTGLMGQERQHEMMFSEKGWKAR